MNYKSGVVSPVESIREGLELIKDSYWVFFGMTLVAIVILFIVSLILNFIISIFVGVIMSALGYPTLGSTSSILIVPQIVSLFLGTFSSVIITTLFGILYCGIFSALSRKADQGIAEFGDLFSAFDKLSPCIVVAIISSIIGFITGLVSIALGGALGMGTVGFGSLMRQDGQLNPAALGATFGVALLFIIAAITFNLIYAALTAFVYPLIAERNLSGAEAFILSIKSGLANIGGLILLMILLVLMTVGGLIACFIGFLFVAPILVASIFIAYRRVFDSPGGQMYQTPPPPPSFGY